MKKIIRNEFYKFFKNKKNIIIIIIFISYLLGMNFYNLNRKSLYMKEQGRIYSNKQAKADGILSSATLLLDNYDEMTLKEKQEINKEKLEKEKEFYNVERNKLLVMRHNYSDDNPEKYDHILISENDRYTNIIQGIENGIIKKEFLNDTNLTMGEINKKTYINKHILENEIQPILNPYTMTGANSLIMFLEGNNLIVLIFLIALLSIDIYLSEVEEGSYKLAYTQPFTRKQIYIGKLITIIVISLLLVTLGIILNFAVVNTIFEMGNLNYPFVSMESIKAISFNGGYGDFIILPLWKCFIMGLVLLLPIVLFTISLIMFISIFTDSSGNTLGFPIMLLVLAFIFNNFLPKESIVNLIYPYSYLFIKNAMEINNRSNYLFGILLNLLLSIGLFILSYYKFLNKDFLGAK